MGVALAAIGAAGSSAQQQRAAEEQARMAKLTSDAEIAARQGVRGSQKDLANQSIANLIASREGARDSLNQYGNLGRAALARGNQDSSDLLSQYGQRSLDTLGVGYGGAQQALGAGYGQAVNDWSQMANPADVVGASGVMGLNDRAMQAGFMGDPGMALQYGAGLQSAAGVGGVDQSKLAALAQYGAGSAAQGYGDYAAQRMAAQGLGLEAMQSQALRDQAMAQSRASGLAGIASMGGQSIADYLAARGQSIAGQQWDMGTGLSQLAAQQAAERYGAYSGTGTQLASLAQGVGSNIAAALTGQAQTNANLMTGIDRSALVAAAGSRARDSAGMWRDLGQLGYLASQRQPNQNNDKQVLNDDATKVIGGSESGFSAKQIWGY